MTAQRRRWGINIASLFPWSFGPGGPRRAWAIAENAGFDGLQILPMRGWDRPEVAIPAESVISFEAAWNTGPLHRAMLRAIGWLDHPHPTIKDWLLFGASRERCHDWKLRAARHFSHAILSQHGIGGWHSHPIEIHPELKLSLNEYKKYPGGLVWDTKHVRRRGRNGTLPSVLEQSSVRLWDFLTVLGPRIRLIHLNLDGEEVAALLYRSASEIGEMCRFLQRQTCDGRCPVILEFAPKLFWSRRELANELAGLRGVLTNEYFKA